MVHQNQPAGPSRRRRRSKWRAVALESNSATRHATLLVPAALRASVRVCVCVSVCFRVAAGIAAGKHERARDGISGKRLPLLLPPPRIPNRFSTRVAAEYHPTSPCGAHRGRTGMGRSEASFHEVGGDRFDRRPRLVKRCFFRNPRGRRFSPTGWHCSLSGFAGGELRFRAVPLSCIGGKLSRRSRTAVGMQCWKLDRQICTRVIAQFSRLSGGAH